MTITTFLTANVPPSTTIEDASSDAGKAWAAFLQGASRLTGHAPYWGRETRDSSKVWMILDWESLPAHNDLKSDAERVTAFQALMQGGISLGLPTIFHASLAGINSTGKEALESPITEVLVAFFAPDDESDKSDFEQVVGTVMNETVASPLTFRPTDVACGWTIEDDVLFTDMQGIQEKGVGYVSVLGWNSLDDHKQWHEDDQGKFNKKRISRTTPKGMSIAFIPLTQQPIEAAV